MKTSQPQPCKMQVAMRPVLNKLCYSLLLAGGIVTQPVFAQISDYSVASETIQSFSVAAGPLDKALSQFGRQAGVLVSANADITAGKQSPGVQGQYRIEDAFTVLLQGTGYYAQKTASGYVITRQQFQNGMMVLDTVKVEARDVATGTLVQAENFLGQTSYNQQSINNMPLQKGHITSLLRLHPAVQFDNSANNSKMPGDMEPADISINGAKFWQNLFMVDGMSVNNDINPGDRNYTNVSGSTTDLPGNKSQGIALDSSLLSRVDVYDSNISAEYGRFTGGVVDAVTRAPTQDFSARTSVTHSRDGWTRYHIDPRKRDSFFNGPAFANSYAREQPEFETWTYRAMMEGHLTENLGLLGSFARRKSTIFNQRSVNSSFVDAGYALVAFKDLDRQFDDYFLKAVWTPLSQLNVETTLKHSPQKSDYYTINAMDGDFQMESGGSQFGIKAQWAGDSINWEHRVNWSEFEQSRTGGPGWYQVWYNSEDKNWGDPTATGVWANMYGTFGNLEQGQEDLGYKLKATFQPMQSGFVEHHITAGLALEKKKGWYQRKEDFTQGTQMESTFTCTDINGVTDNRHCSVAPLLNPPQGWPQGSGQMITKLNVYQAGKIAVEQNSWALWAEDRIRIGQLQIRPGVRVDNDDYMAQTTIAPRFSAEYDVFGDQHTRLIAGANRYYGRNVLDMALRDGRELLKSEKTRNTTDLVWSPLAPPSGNMTRFSELDVPYDDELMLAVQQMAWDMSFELKYVNRKGKDQIVRELVDGPHDDPLLNQNYHYEYRNAGHSGSDNISLNISSLQSFELWGSKTSGQFTVNWMDVQESHTFYNSALDSEWDNRIVRYDGKFIRYADRPASNYNRPVTTRFNLVTEVPDWHLTLSHYLRWSDSFGQIVNISETVPYQGSEVDVYEHREVGSSITWDMRISWEYPVAAKHTVFINLDVMNVLNKRNPALWSSSEITYDLGRQFVLELGYQF